MSRGVSAGSSRARGTKRVSGCASGTHGVALLLKVRPVDLPAADADSCPVVAAALEPHLVEDAVGCKQTRRGGGVSAVVRTRARQPGGGRKPDAQLSLLPLVHAAEGLDLEVAQQVSGALEVVLRVDRLGLGLLLVRGALGLGRGFGRGCETRERRRRQRRPSAKAGARRKTDRLLEAAVRSRPASRGTSTGGPSGARAGARGRSRVWRSQESISGQPSSLPVPPRSQKADAPCPP